MCVTTAVLGNQMCSQLSGYVSVEKVAKEFSHNFNNHPRTPKKTQQNLTSQLLQIRLRWKAQTWEKITDLNEVSKQQRHRASTVTADDAHPALQSIHLVFAKLWLWLTNSSRNQRTRCHQSVIIHACCSAATANFLTQKDCFRTGSPFLKDEVGPYLSVYCVFSVAL